MCSFSFTLSGASMVKEVASAVENIYLYRLQALVSTTLCQPCMSKTRHSHKIKQTSLQLLFEEETMYSILYTSIHGKEEVICIVDWYGVHGACKCPLKGNPLTLNTACERSSCTFTVTQNIRRLYIVLGHDTKQRQCCSAQLDRFACSK